MAEQTPNWWEGTSPWEACGERSWHADARGTGSPNNLSFQSQDTGLNHRHPFLAQSSNDLSETFAHKLQHWSHLSFWWLWHLYAQHTALYSLASSCSAILPWHLRSDQEGNPSMTSVSSTTLPTPFLLPSSLPRWTLMPIFLTHPEAPSLQSMALLPLVPTHVLTTFLAHHKFHETSQKSLYYIKLNSLALLCFALFLTKFNPR